VGATIILREGFLEVTISSTPAKYVSRQAKSGVLSQGMCATTVMGAAGVRCGTNGTVVEIAPSIESGRAIRGIHVILVVIHGTIIIPAITTMATTGVKNRHHVPHEMTAVQVVLVVGRAATAGEEREKIDVVAAGHLLIRHEKWRRGETLVVAGALRLEEHRSGSLRESMLRRRETLGFLRYTHSHYLAMAA